MLDDYHIVHRLHTMEDTPDTQSTKLQSKRMIYSAEYTQAVGKVSSILILRNKLRGFQNRVCGNTRSSKVGILLDSKSCVLCLVSLLLLFKTVLKSPC